MASTTQSRSTLTAILKNVYDKDFHKAIQNEVMFFKDASRKQMPLDGTDLVTAVHVGRNTSFGARAVDAAMPDARSETVVNGTLRATRAFAGFQISNEVIKLSKRDEAAFVEALDLCMDGPKEFMSKQLERMAVGNGKGVLATVVSEAAGVVTVDTTRYLEEGMVVDIWASPTSTTKEANSIAISSINSDTTFTLASDPGAFTAGGVVRIEDNSADVSGLTHYEMNGILNIADDDTDFMGVAYATYRRWRGYVKTASAAVSPALIAQTLIELRQRGSGDLPDTIWCHPVQSYGFIYGSNGTYPDVRFTTANVNDAGADDPDPTVSLGAKRAKLRTSIDFAKDKIVMFPKNDLFYGELNGIELEEYGENGQALLPVTDGDGNVFPAVRGWYGWRGNLGCFRRNNFALIDALTVPTGF